MIQLYYGQWLYIISCSVILLSIGALLLYRCRRTLHVVRLLTNVTRDTTLLLNFSPFRLSLKAVCTFLGFAFLLIALLRPQSPGSKITIPQEGRDVFIALDISRSMLAADCSPSRLECAKKKIRDLLGQLSFERVGLILFSGTAFVQCPLTHDYSAFCMFLDQLDVETISSGTTNIDQAIALAAHQITLLSGRKHTLLLLVTDGEDFSASTTQRPVVPGLHIFALGVGTPEGAPIPLFDLQGRQIGHQKDQQGSIVMTALNESLLQQITEQSGGTYVRSTKTDDDIHEIIRLIQRYEKEQFNQTTVTQRHEWYPLCVGVSLFFWVLEWLL